jgi:HSP20 family protein
MLRYGFDFRPGTREVPFDAVRDDDRLVLSFDLPGYRAEDIELTVDRGVLHLTAERAALTGDDVQVLRRERFAGRVGRTLRLGDRYDGDSVEADFTDGVLTITLPVREAAKPRRIEIGSPAVEAA